MWSAGRFPTAVNLGSLDRNCYFLLRFEFFTAVTIKNGVFWDATTDVSEELSASFIRVTRIGELGTTLAVTSNRRTLRRNINGPVASYS
jgi:hypothetical protein